MADYNLPDVGEGLIEAEIVTWRVQVGDVVKVNDVVVEIETAKSLVELPSPYAGTVQAIHVPEGETVAVGTPIVSIGDPVPVPVEMPVPAPPLGPALDFSNPAASGGENQTLVGYGPRAAPSQRRARRVATGAGAGDGAAGTGPGTGTGTDARVDVQAPPVQARPAVDHTLAKPPVRKLAKDLGVDLRSVVPSGPGGTVTRQDVTSATGPSAPPAGRASAGAGRERREPVKGVRRMMAQAMVESAFTAPHVTEWLTLDVTRTMRLLDRLRAHRDFREVRVSPLLVVAKAVCLAARRTPEVNAAWDEATGEVVFKSYVNLGIAAATPRGLVVPNIKDADTLSLTELAVAINELARTARDGRTQPSAMAGGSFTITNVGVFGIDAGTPIINPGEAAILCAGTVRKQPWVVSKAGRDKIKPRDVMTLALSFDHRLVDGEQGSRFLADVAAVMSDPGTALLF